jgi:hypothetical protein
VTTPPTDLDSWRALRRAVGDARLLGTVFIGVGGLFLIPLAMRWDRIVEQLLTASASLLLIAPGVLYWIAATSLKHRKPAGAILARRAATAHLLAIGGSIGLGLIAGAWGAFDYAVFFPAVIATFFVPAMVAFLVQTRTAVRAAQLLDDTGRAFEPLVARPILQAKEAERLERDDQTVT